VSSSATEPAAAVLVDVVMPALGTSIAEGTLVEWKLAVGDAVGADAVVCDITTDKVDSEVPAPCAGTLAEIVVQPGETVDVGAVLARIATDSPPAGVAPARAPAPAGSAGAALPASAEPGGDRATPAAATRRYSPVVTRIAAEHGVALAAVAGTGRGGRVTKRDVLAHIASVNGHAAAPADEERPLHSESPYRPDPVSVAAPAVAPAATPQPSPGAGGGAPAGAVPAALGGEPRQLSRMRRSIGTAMRNSLSVAATCTTIVECDMSRTEARRRELGLTALPLVARATVETLREFGDLNATLDGDTITRYDRVHLGIAVSLGDDGLIVPVIHDAQHLSEEGIGSRVKDLAARARARALAPDEVRGATFTITSPGAFGALIATPVIDVPQVAILDLEAIVRRPVVVTDAGGDEAIAIRPMVNLCMSWDHRALDGVYAARFLTALRRRLERG
jgi:pyruvate/2-oxoglutarate dehydrogenase complex dihydrolipoamide acyltransferase (E2) component